jgi:hypothetical protein
MEQHACQLPSKQWLKRYAHGVLAWHTRDIPAIIAMEAQAVGFGSDRSSDVTISQAAWNRRRMYNWKRSQQKEGTDEH